ncbi:MAG: hypothetical protein CMH63_02140 [Nanoarchaeota archaeon]|mgnify:CR=1 FL=1|jgi:sugar-specific transcriptional regulator TrmB|nr:hypothetical protein [Nanoarchaeota archaeon]|tara:strand:+ start:17475 stop:18197 length:723 start_codon:yes stop_codon:yes gene_type:complete
MEKQSLINLGLSDGEAKVYLALLKLGSSSVGPITKEADVAYSNIYDILDRLLEKGLISFILKEKTKYFQAVPPSRLNEFIEKKEDKLREEKSNIEQLIPELERIQHPSSKQEAEIFTGLKGIRTAYERMLENANKKSEWLFFYIDEGKITDDFYSTMYSKFKKIKMKGIANKIYKKSEFIKKTHFEMKYVNFPLPGMIDIYEDKIMFISWKSNPLVVLITSKDMAQKFRDYFYSIWKGKT